MATKSLFVASMTHVGQHDEAVIKCAMKGDVVRTLTQVDPHHLRIQTGPDDITVSLDKPLGYEPWMMDRGSITFEHEGQTLKLCTEWDILELPDGQQFVIKPAESISKMKEKT